MKKLLVLLMSTAMVISLCACGGGSGGGSSKDTGVEDALQGTWKEISTTTVDLTSEVTGGGSVSASVATELVFRDGKITATSALHTVDTGFGVSSIYGAEATGTYQIEDGTISMKWTEKEISYDDFASFIPDSISYTYENGKLSLSDDTLTALEYAGHDGCGESIGVDAITETLTNNGWYFSIPLSTYHTSINYFFQTDGYAVATYNVREKSSSTETPLVTFVGTYTVNADTVDIEWLSVDPAEYASSFSIANSIWYYCENGEVSLSYFGIPMKSFEY